MPDHTHSPSSGSGELFAFIHRHPISKGLAEHYRHATIAADACQRAVIFLRMLVGEADWSDGYERRVDDCFEMNDGDEVCRTLLGFAAADPRIRNLLASHRLVGERVLQEWSQRYPVAS